MFLNPTRNDFHDPYLMPDMEKAVDWLREKGIAKAAKKESRIAAEGTVCAKVCADCGVHRRIDILANDGD